MRKNRKMTSREQEVYAYIVEYVKVHLYAPSFQDICEATGLKSKSSVYIYIHSLKEKGFIEVGENPRCIKLLGYKIVKSKD